MDYTYLPMYAAASYTMGWCILIFTCDGANLIETIGFTLCFLGLFLFNVYVSFVLFNKEVGNDLRNG